ncbi:MAG: translation initiation factor IF-2 [Planctomycetota bacterium]
MAIRLYHLAYELHMQSSDLLKKLRSRGVSLPSVMTVLNDEKAAQARRVLAGEETVAAPQAPKPGDALEIKLPPPIVPAPARPARPATPARGRGAASGRGGAPARPGAGPHQPRKGIRIFRQKETRERKAADRQRGEEIYAGRTIPITVPITLKEFSQQIGVKSNQLLVHLMRQGVMATQNTTLDEDTVMVLGESFNRTIELQSAKNVEDELSQLLETAGATEEGTEKTTRPPVVAVLGHVDHGKTSLLDHIRTARVTAGEAGGITQHIGAYTVELEGDRKITFLDTPGHEAFTAMRARGAKVTDIVILIVAADDGVMPQTEEALNHARAAEVPIIVAINKCDLPQANPEKARQQLSALNLAPEEWGGTTAMIEVSAHSGQGVPELLERISLEAELLDLQGVEDKAAEGFVVEASKQTGRGVVATLLVKDGTLNRGDLVLTGACQGRVKSMTDDRGTQVKAAPPSSAVEVTGLDEVPEAGWRFQVIQNKDLAKKVAVDRQQRQREQDLASKAGSPMERLMDRLGSAETRELRLVLKADVKGSVEAIRAKVEQLSNDDVKVKLLHAAVGAINESDILLAEASGAMILGFHVIADAKSRQAAEKAGVTIRLYQIIYELLGDIKGAVEGLLPTDTRETVTGHAEIRQIFVYRKSKIAGCMVTDGNGRRDSKVRLVRDGRVIYDNGELESLKRFKDDAKEVREGYECGLKIAGYEDIKEGDIVEFYDLEEVRRTLE